jgi:hypothetical protein
LIELWNIDDMILLRQWSDLRRIGRHFEFCLWRISGRGGRLGFCCWFLALTRVEVGGRYEGNRWCRA